MFCIRLFTRMILLFHCATGSYGPWLVVDVSDDVLGDKFTLVVADNHCVLLVDQRQTVHVRVQFTFTNIWRTLTNVRLDFMCSADIIHRQLLCVCEHTDTYRQQNYRCVVPPLKRGPRQPLNCPSSRTYYLCNNTANKHRQSRCYSGFLINPIRSPPTRCKSMLGS